MTRSSDVVAGTGAPDEGGKDGGLTRRRMIKGLGAGVAVAWIAPAVVAVTPAAAAAVSATTCSSCSPNCDAPVPCGTCANGRVCGCRPTVGYQFPCFCHEDPMACSDVPTCETGACPPGLVCVVTTCCNPSMICVPLCGTAIT